MIYISIVSFSLFSLLFFLSIFVFLKRSLNSEDTTIKGWFKKNGYLVILIWSLIFLISGITTII